MATILDGTDMNITISVDMSISTDIESKYWRGFLDKIITVFRSVTSIMYTFIHAYNKMNKTALKKFMVIGITYHGNKIG